MTGETTTVILVVSDDPRLASELEMSFPDGYSVRAARDAREVKDAMGEGAPEAVVVEIRSGNAGGFALARDMSQKVALRDIPIVMLLEREQDQWLSDQAGAAETLVQPVAPVDIARAVVTHIQGQPVQA